MDLLLEYLVTHPKISNTTTSSSVPRRLSAGTAMHNREHTSDACMFLLFFLLTPVTPMCRNGTAVECLKAKFVPGYNQSSKGFDIVYLTMMLRDWANVNQWQTPNGGCTLCENPLLEGKPLQKLPLIISDWKASISCQMKVQHSAHQSGISVAKALTELAVKNNWGNQLDVKIKPTKKVQWALAGSRSGLTQSCEWKSSLDKYIFLLHHITCSYYKFHVNQKYIIWQFRQNLRQLPEKYDPNSPAIEYLDFIENYGTHIGSDLDLGVHIRRLTAFPVCQSVLEGVTVSEVSRCLAVDMGIAFGLDGVTNSSDFQMCEEKKKKSNFFRELLSGESMEWWGGTMPSNTVKEWLESGKSRPVVLSYSLEPLHALVPLRNPRRVGLKQAVSDYVRKNTLWRNCTHSCPKGSQPSATDFCSCECPSNNFTNSMCCSPKRGLAKLMVKIEGANDLWGDYITRSDAYVSVMFQKRQLCTDTVWNNDDPTWNVNLDFGVVQLNTAFSILHLEVWDEDYGWNDDLLGMCEVAVKSWTYEHQTCDLYYGQLHFTYLLLCGPTLGGPFCRDYISLLPNDDDDYHGQNHDSYLQ